jgi:hypothetical protein
MLRNTSWKEIHQIHKRWAIYSLCTGYLTSKYANGMKVFLPDEAHHESFRRNNNAHSYIAEQMLVGEAL